MADKEVETDCEPSHAGLVSFNEEEARELSSDEIRKRWPRGKCKKCGAIIYASYAHYLYGDW